MGGPVACIFRLPFGFSFALAADGGFGWGCGGGLDLGARHCRSGCGWDLGSVCKIGVGLSIGVDRWREKAAASLTERLPSGDLASAVRAAFGFGCGCGFGLGVGFGCGCGFCLGFGLLGCNLCIGDDCGLACCRCLRFDFGVRLSCELPYADLSATRVRVRSRIAQIDVLPIDSVCCDGCDCLPL